MPVQLPDPIIRGTGYIIRKADKDKDDSLPRPQAPVIGGPAATT